VESNTEENQIEMGNTSGDIVPLIYK